MQLKLLHSVYAELALVVNRMQLFFEIQSFTVFLEASKYEVLCFYTVHDTVHTKKRNATLL